ncbi:MAG: NADP-dependent isocitrate dehydrogenase [Alphaproteobacteria bacterium]
MLPGDGVGPEVMQSCLTVLKAVCPRLDWTLADAGAKVVERGIASGLPKETVEAVIRTPVVLKGPCATPVGHGSKSVNVTIRKFFELYGNVRPVRSLQGLNTPYADRLIDLIVVRENVEDLYAGIEYMQTPDVAQCLKLVTRKGSEKAVRLAFSLAQAERRPTIHCATKANIMKLTEGLFKSVFEDVSDAFPRIEAHHMLIDNCAHQLVMRPEQFDVIVTTNMNGDIISDLAAGLVGGLGLAPSANLGDSVAVFEPVHGSAPDIAGRNRANPTAMIRSGILMLQHLGLSAEASRVEDALALVYEDGRALTGDVSPDGDGVGTDRFTDAVLEALEAVPLPGPRAGNPSVPEPSGTTLPKRSRRVQFDGVDIFVEWTGTVDDLARLLKSLTAHDPFDLTMISNRGTVVYPVSSGFTDTVDHWRCRFMYRAGDRDGGRLVGALIDKLAVSLRWMHVEQLICVDGQPGYSRAQGEG